MLVDQAFRRALVQLSSSAAEAGVPIMQRRLDGGDGSGEGTLPRLLQMALDEPALDTSDALLMLKASSSSSMQHATGNASLVQVVLRGMCCVYGYSTKASMFRLMQIL